MDPRFAKPQSPEKNSSKAWSLEDIVRMANKVGLQYANAKKEAERLELLKPSVKAQIMLRIEKDESFSETKLRRLCETDAEYIGFIEKLAAAKGDSEKLRIKYESFKNLFEARRSMLSYQKAEMKLL